MHPARQAAWGVTAALLLTTACAAEQPPPVPSTYAVPPATVRPGETALRLPTTNDGDTTFTPLGLSTGIPTVIGSHAEWHAKGQYVRVRLSVGNTGRSSVLFDAWKQKLVDANNTEYAVDQQAMAIKRQPKQTDLGSGVRLEFDVYYDIPKDAKPVKLRVFGGPTLTDLQDAAGTELPLA